MRIFVKIYPKVKIIASCNTVYAHIMRELNIKTTLYIYMCACVYVCVCVCVCVCVRACVYIYIIYLCVCIYINFTARRHSYPV